ncbi:MAG: hypothetical protein M3475_02340 [Actinomycetota bacterium]|nr:hypothetical protein [Actinomycetota bacterium]
MYRVEISPARRRTLALVTVVFSALVLSTFAVGGARFATAQETAAPNTENDEFLPEENLVLESAVAVNLSKDFATLPLHKGNVDGETVWFVITDTSDEAIADELGLNFAPKLSNITTGCPLCAQQVESESQILGESEVTFEGKPDFSPKRILEPGPAFFPPQLAQPGALADAKYSPFVRVKGSDVVYNAPIVAVGDGPFDAMTHTNTHDRLLAIDPEEMTVDMGLIRGSANGKDIVYLNFDASNSVTATLERSIFVPNLALSSFPNGSTRQDSARAEIFTFVNGPVGQESPPAQGIRHLIRDGLSAQELNLENTELLEALRNGGDLENVFEIFPTLEDPALAEAYTPLWDLNVGVWSDAAVAEGRNVALRDANEIRAVAATGELTSPGGLPLASANEVINCPALGFTDEPPLEPVVSTVATPIAGPVPDPVRAAIVAAATDPEVSSPTTATANLPDTGGMPAGRFGPR